MVYLEGFKKTATYVDFTSRQPRSAAFWEYSPLCKVTPVILHGGLSLCLNQPALSPCINVEMVKQAGTCHVDGYSACGNNQNET